MDKAEVARRQLGTALHMFLRQEDPVSVHSLAMAGGEVAEHLAQQAGADAFLSHIRATFPEKSIGEIKTIQRQYYNAFKHVTLRDGTTREDDDVLASFDPNVNDHALFIGWYDFMMSGLPTPIEAQVFTAWYAVKYIEKVNPEYDMSAHERVFPNLRRLSPQRQLDRLRDMIRKQRKNGVVMQDAKTDQRPLVLRW